MLASKQGDRNPNRWRSQNETAVAWSRDGKAAVLVPRREHKGLRRLLRFWEGNLFRGIVDPTFERLLADSSSNLPGLGPFDDLAVSSLLRIVAAGSRKEDGTNLWVLGQDEERDWSAHVPGGISSLAFNPAGDRLVVGSQDGHVVVFDPRKETPLWHARVGREQVLAFRFMPSDGSFLAAHGGAIVRWLIDRPEKEIVAELGTAVFTFDVSGDGKRLAIPSKNLVEIWDVRSHQPLGEPVDGHTMEVNDARFAPDGKTLATAGKDGTIRLLDLGTPKPECFAVFVAPEFASNHGLEGGMEQVVFTPNGKHVVAKDGSGVYSFPATPEGIKLFACRAARRLPEYNAEFAAMCASILANAPPHVPRW